MKKLLVILLSVLLVCSSFAVSTSAIGNRTELMEITQQDGDYSVNANPYTSYAYSKTRAVNYAMEFYNKRNTYFYDIKNANCTNFVSQCVSYGFGSSSSTSYTNSSSYRMKNNGNYSTGWYATQWGCSGPWESVNAHWTYMTSTKTNAEGPRVMQINQSQIGLGDVMQLDFDNDGTYDHSVICVQTNPLKFAQNTYDDLKLFTQYSSDYGKRYYRPTSYRVY